MRDLTRELGVGTCCGKCVPEARVTLSDSLDALKSRASCFNTPSTEFAV